MKFPIPALCLAFAVLASLISGCGLALEGGAVALFLYLNDEEENPPPSNSPPVLVSAQVVETGFFRNGVQIQAVISDAEGDSADVLIEYSTDFGSSWLAGSFIAVPPGEAPLGLSAAPGGTAHTFIWDSPVDAPVASAGWNKSVMVRLTPSDSVSGNAGSAWESSEFAINVNNPPLVTALTPQGGADETAVRYILIDPESDAADLVVEFSSDGGTNWLPATMGEGGQGTTAVSASPGGLGHLFVWDSLADLPGASGQNALVQVRLSASDPAPPPIAGNTWMSLQFTANVNTPPSVSAATPAGNFPLVVRFAYTLTDAEADDAGVEVEYSVNTGSWSPWAAATAKSSDPAHEGAGPLATSVTGMSHTFVWDSSTQVPAPSSLVKLRIRPSDWQFGAIAGSWFETGQFTINTSSGNLPTASGSTPAGVQMFDVRISYVLSDLSGDPADITVRYSTNGGGQWFDASVSSSSPEGTVGLAASPGGSPHTFVWDSWSDVSAAFSTSARIRIEPSEGGLAGIAWESGDFILDDRRMVSIGGLVSSSFSSPVGVALDADGNIYVLDSALHQVKAFNTQSSAATLAGVAIPAGEVRVIAGTGSAGYNGDDMPAVSAKFSSPQSFALSGSNPPDIYIADSGNHRIRRIDGITGYVTTVAGTGTAGKNGDDGPALFAQLKYPAGIAVLASGNLVIADRDNYVLRLVNRQGVSVTLAGTQVGPGRLRTVCGTIGQQGFTLDSVTEASPASVLLHLPVFAGVDSSGNVFWSEDEWSAVFVINAQAASISVCGKTVGSGMAALVAGDYPWGDAGDGGSAQSARLGKALGAFALAPSGNLFVVDKGNSRIRLANSQGSEITAIGVAIQSGCIDTVCGKATATKSLGDGGPAINAILSGPGQAALDSAGNLFLADAGNRRIRAVNAQDTGQVLAGKTIPSHYIDTVCGGESQAFALSAPMRISLSSGKVLIADSSLHKVLRFDPSSGTCTVVAGTGTKGFSGDGQSALNATLDSPEGAAADTNGNVYIADTLNDRVRVVNTQTISITVCGVLIPAGCIQTVGGSSTFDDPSDVFVLSSGDVAVADKRRHRIALINAATGNVTTIAGTLGSTGSTGDGGAATSAKLSQPTGLFLDAAGNLYIADTGNDKVRAVNRGNVAASFFSISINPGCIATVAGTGSASYGGDNMPAVSTGLSSPRDVCLGLGGRLLIADMSNNRIRSVDSAGIIRTAAGTGVAGYGGEFKPPSNSDLNLPCGVAADGLGVVFVSDTGNLVVRRFGE